MVLCYMLYSGVQTLTDGIAAYYGVEYIKILTPGVKDCYGSLRSGAGFWQ